MTIDDVLGGGGASAAAEAEQVCGRFEISPGVDSRLGRGGGGGSA